MANKVKSSSAKLEDFEDTDDSDDGEPVASTTTSDDSGKASTTDSGEDDAAEDAEQDEQGQDDDDDDDDDDDEEAGPKKKGRCPGLHGERRTSPGPVPYSSFTSPKMPVRSTHSTATTRLPNHSPRTLRCISTCGFQCHP